MRAPKAVLLDALGTLVALEPPAPRLVAALAQGATSPVRITLEEAAAAMRAEIAYYRAHHDVAVDAAALADLRARCTAVLRRALPEPARAVEDLHDAAAGRLRFRAYPDAEPALRRCAPPA